MGLLSDFLVKNILEDENYKSTTALYAGGFKPPTSGHYEVVEQALKENPEIDKFIILIGSGVRNNITQDQSFKIWEIYKKSLSPKLEIVKTKQPPIKLVYDYAKNNPAEEVLWVVGAREGNEEDFKDLAKRTKNIDNYNNLELRTIVTTGGVSGTAARNTLPLGFEKFKKFLPDNLDLDTQTDIFNILNNKITESKFAWTSAIDIKSKELFLEDASYSQHINYRKEIRDLTRYMLNIGMNMTPLPKVIFKHKDTENAKQFLGKTAYYDPNNQHIVLYTEGRHPKDILRSYAHEMIHHIQYLEDRLHNITTTNTNEDEDLDAIEKEAYLRGNITFRKWTDSITGNSLQEGKKKDPFGLKAYAHELARGLEEQESEYKIYLDMDGVLVDFDKGYKNLTGVSTTHADRQGRDEFWDLFRNSLEKKGIDEIDYWANLPWMSDGNTLWEYVKKYNPYILTAPSINPTIPKPDRYKPQFNQSIQGKEKWVKRLDNIKRVYYKSAKFKSDLAGPNKILIDDREDTIARWNAAGGIGIHHTNTQNTIKQLKDLGL